MNMNLAEIKNILKRISLLKIIVLILALIILNNVIKAIGEMGIRGQALPQYNEASLSSIEGTISAKSGEFLAASSESKRMYVDTETLNIRIEDMNTGAVWNAIPTDEDANASDKSPIIIRYLGKDSTIYEWDAFTYCISNDRYAINKIKNGVQFIFDFMETTSARLSEYMPQKISIERYEEVFIEKMKEMVADGSMDKDKAERYKAALDLVYSKDEEQDCYYNRFSGVPPISITTLLIEFSKEIGYTTDMLKKDSAEFGIDVVITEPANFKITVEAVLDKDDLVVRIPTYEFETGNSDYMLQNIMVFPGFGYVSALDTDEGFIFAPDGSGALFKLNNYDGVYPEYSRPVYDNTFYDTRYEMSNYPENIKMPVFGMAYNNEKGDLQGFLGIIEEGAETAYINVRLGSKDINKGGIPYNKVFSSFDSMQYSRVKVFGPYSTNDARYLSTTGLIHVDYKVRYKLFTEDATYFNMAKAYRDYLIRANNLYVNYENKPKLFLDVISSLSVKSRFLGIPYEDTISMTTYAELTDILKDLQEINKVVSYSGMFNNGLYNKLLNRVETVPENGSKEDYEQLMNIVKSNGDELFINVNLLRVYSEGNGFNPGKHALYGFDGKPAVVMNYDLSTGQYNSMSRGYYLLNPKYLSSVVGSFIKNTKAYDHIYINDIGDTYYASYKQQEIIDPYSAKQILNSNIEQLAEKKTIAINNPNIDQIGYIKYAVNISRESSNFGTMYTSIPFRQLVLNGLTEYTTLDVNMSSDSSDYYVLQALELGSHPKFTISGKSVDILKAADFHDYFSIEYSKLANTIKSVYAEYKEGFNKIGSQEIVNHRILSDNVFETTYKSGAKVIVNYNKFPVTVENDEINALDYIIKTGD